MAAVRELIDQGLNDCEVARRSGIPRSTIREWRHRPSASRTPKGCGECGHPQHDPQALPRAAYSYLLGLYLGDGYIVHTRRGVYWLRVFLDLRYPGIIESCADAMQAVIGKKPGMAYTPGCVAVNTHSKQWPCLFPQHGPGPKHLRPIELVEWQQAIVAEHPEALLRGLVHSDGCRHTNRVTVRGKRYAYPRYNFTNASDDIRQIFCDACDAIGVEWRRMNARNISVARRASVARLDEFIGPKA